MCLASPPSTNALKSGEHFFFLKHHLSGAAGSRRDVSSQKGADGTQTFFQNIPTHRSKRSAEKPKGRGLKRSSSAKPLWSSRPHAPQVGGRTGRVATPQTKMATEKTSEEEKSSRKLESWSWRRWRGIIVQDEHRQVWISNWDSEKCEWIGVTSLQALKYTLFFLFKEIQTLHLRWSGHILREIKHRVGHQGAGYLEMETPYLRPVLA